MSHFQSTIFDKNFDAMCKSKSLYIPLLPKDIVLPDGRHLYEKEVLIDFFQNKLFLGEVTRIDYITKPTRVDDKAIGVFVHFADWHRNITTDYIINNMNEDGEAIINSYWDYNLHETFPFISSFNNQRRYIKYKINHSPIPNVIDVPTNISQIVHDNTAMKAILIEKDAKIAELEQKILQLTRMMHNDAVDKNTTELVAAV